MKQRMRRISALLLVALMCVSCMVPAFAADGEECPAIHTKTNCPNKQIGEPHEASCGEQGYTTYQCLDCNTYFAADFVEAAADHAYQMVIQAPTCTDDGFMKQVCIYCGDEEIIGAEDDDEFKATGHDWVAKNGKDCEEGVYCSVCKVEAKEIADSFHVWGDPELLKTPDHDEDGETDDGQAKVTCTICGETKNVVIIAVGDHEYQVEAPKAPSCTEEGNVGGAKCGICGKVVHFTQVAGCEKDLVCTVPGCDHGNTEGCELDLTCTVPGCAHYEFVEHCTEEDCEHEDCDDAGCTAAPFESIEVIDCTLSDEWVVELPTCTTEGKAYKACTMCGKAGTPVTLSPLGHNYQTRVYEVATTGGMTAEEIALFEALARATEDASYSYTFLVEGENGELTPVTGTAEVEDYVIFGSDDELTAAVASGADDDDDDVVRYVWTGEFKNDDPTSKDPAGNTYMHWGANCSTETSSYRYHCTVCGADEEPVSFIGHYWVPLTETVQGMAPTKAPVCGNIGTDAEADGYTMYVCANPNCDGCLEDRDEDAEDESILYAELPEDVLNGDSTVKHKEGTAVKLVVIKAAHTFKTEEHKVTCEDQGYKVDKCEVCGAIDLTKAAEGHGKNEDDELQDGWYDIVEIDPENLQHDTEKVWLDGLMVTCEKDGYYNLVCKICDEVLKTAVKVEALGCEANLEKEIVGMAESATCYKPGYKYYECVHAEEYNCQKPVKVESAPMLKHNFTAKEVVKADCLNGKPGYTIIKCKNSGCDAVSPDFVEPTVFDKENPEHHSSVRVVTVTVGDCTTLDTVVYQCNVCGYVFTVEEDYVNEATGHGEGEGAGHDPEEQLAVKPTCTKLGQIKHYKCDVCGERFEDKECTKPLTEAQVQIKKLTEDGHPADKLIIVDYKAPTCTEAGNYEGRKCTLCGEMETEATVIDPTGHSWDTFRVRTANCTEWGFLWQVCTCDGCDAEQIINYAPDLGGHKSEIVKGWHETCCSDGMTDGDMCPVCSTSEEIYWNVEPQVIAKAPHVNAKGEEFYGLCTDTVEDRVCVACKKGEYTYTDSEGRKVTLKASEGDFVCSATEGDHDLDADIFVNEKGETVAPVALPDDEKLEKGAHKWVVTYVPATCMSYSYTLVVCDYCGYDFMTEEGFTYSDEHLFWGDWEIVKEANTLEAGLKVRKCECGAEEKLEIPALAGLEISVELENAVKPGAALPNNGKINVIVKTNASDLDVWGIQLELNISNNLKFVKDVSKSAKFTDIGVNRHVDGNTIKIVATAPNVDGKVANVNLDGEEVLIVLQFELVNASLYDTFSVSANVDPVVNDKDQNKIGAEFALDYEDASIMVEAERGDVIANGEVTIDDAKALMLFVTGEANEVYNSAADMNQDGEVTMTDFSAIINALLGTTGVLPQN